MKRGEIWTVSGGGEYAGKPRPVVIVQDDSFDGTDSITICAFTTDPTDAPLFRLPVVPNPRNGLRAPCRLMVDKITTVSKSKVGTHVGHLDDAGKMSGVHHFGHDQQTGLPSHLHQQPEPFLAEPLKGVGRGPGFPGAASKESREWACIARSVGYQNRLQAITGAKICLKDRFTGISYARTYRPARWLHNCLRPRRHAGGYDR